MTSNKRRRHSYRATDTCTSGRSWHGGGGGGVLRASAEDYQEPPASGSRRRKKEQSVQRLQHDRSGTNQTSACSKHTTCCCICSTEGCNARIIEGSRHLLCLSLDVVLWPPRAPSDRQATQVFDLVSVRRKLHAVMHKTVRQPCCARGGSAAAASLPVPMNNAHACACVASLTASDAPVSERFEVLP